MRQRDHRVRYAPEEHDHPGGVEFPEVPEGKFWSNQGWVEIPSPELDDEDFFRRGFDYFAGYGEKYVPGYESTGPSNAYNLKTVDCMPYEKMIRRSFYTRNYSNRLFPADFQCSNDGFGGVDGFAWRMVYGIQNPQYHMMRHRFWSIGSQTGTWSTDTSNGVEIMFHPTYNGPGGATINLMRGGLTYKTFEFPDFRYTDGDVYALDFWGAGGNLGMRYRNITRSQEEIGWTTDEGNIFRYVKTFHELIPQTNPAAAGAYIGYIHVSHTQAVQYFGKRGLPS